MNIEELILEAKKNNDYIYIESAHNYDIDWNEFIDILSQVNSTSSANNSDKRFIKDDILVYDKLDIVIFNALANEKIKNIHDRYKNSLSLKSSSVKILGNLLGNEGEYWVHPDPHDVITFQLKGTVEYRIFKNVPESRFHSKDSSGLEYESYIIKPGDIVYMSKGVVHQAIVNGPRITAILDIYDF